MADTDLQAQLCRIYMANVDFSVRFRQLCPGRHCKRRGRIDVGSQSVLTRCWYPSKQRDVGYEGCTKEEGEAVC
jgi:hypothetical protein